MENTRTTKGAGQRETGQSSRFTQNSSNQPNGRPGGSAPQRTSPNRGVSWLRWLIFIIVINLLSLLKNALSKLISNGERIISRVVSNRD